MAQRPCLTVSFDERTPEKEVEAFCNALRHFFTARYAEWGVICKAPSFLPRGKRPSVSVHVTDEHLEALQEVLKQFLSDDPRSNEIDAQVELITVWCDEQ